MEDRVRDFIKASPQAIEHWKRLRLADYPSPFARELPEATVPFYGTGRFTGLSAGEKQGLAREFIKINAEALIVLEQALLVAARADRRNRLEGEPGQASRKLAREELYHTRAFRRFLVSEPALEWREKGLFMLRNRRCRAWLCWIANRYPAALCLPGAKIEAYSVGYSASLKEAFGSWDANSWTKINHLHAMDEAHHVPYQFGAYVSAFPRGRAARLQLAAGTLLFVGLLQILLFSGARRMVGHAMPGRPSWERFAWTLRVGRWVVRSFKPYQDARRQMRRHLADPRLPLGRLFSFMAW